MNQQYRRGMKAKTIRQTIQSKLNDWANSVRVEGEGEEAQKKKEVLRDIILNKTVVTGGSIASMLLGEDVNDFDVYFRDAQSAITITEHYLAEFLKGEKEKEDNATDDEEQTVNTVQRRNCRVSDISVKETPKGVKLMIKSAGVLDEEVSLEDYQYFEALPVEAVERYFSKPRYYDDKGKFYPTMFTDNAITFTDKLQVILRFVGEPDQIHENYDFAHCKNYYTGGKLYLDKDAMESLLSRELRYVGSLYPVCSLFRLRKFLSRGWTIMASEVFKIAYDVSHLDLNSIKVLEEQLMGVDYAYFSEVINVLRKEDTKELNRTYLFELVNRVFDDLPEVPVEEE